MGVLHLVHGDGLREGEDAPVCEAADDAAIAEDLGADGLGDSRGVGVSSWSGGFGAQGRFVGGRFVVDVLLHLGEVARADLLRVISKSILRV